MKYPDGNDELPCEVCGLEAGLCECPEEVLAQLEHEAKLRWIEDGGNIGEA